MEICIDDCVFGRYTFTAPGMMICAILSQGNQLVAELPSIEKLTIEIQQRTGNTHLDWRDPNYLFNLIREICRADGTRIKPALYVTLNPGIWLPHERRSDPAMLPEAWERVKKLRRV